MGCEQGANTLRLHRRRRGWTPRRSTKMYIDTDELVGSDEGYAEGYASGKREATVEIEELKEKIKKLEKEIKKLKKK